jgi:hypothetical protein
MLLSDHVDRQRNGCAIIRARERSTVRWGEFRRRNRVQRSNVAVSFAETPQHQFLALPNCRFWNRHSQPQLHAQRSMSTTAQLFARGLYSSYLFATLDQQQRVSLARVLMPTMSMTRTLQVTSASISLVQPGTRTWIYLQNGEYNRYTGLGQIA